MNSVWPVEKASLEFWLKTGRVVRLASAEQLRVDRESLTLGFAGVYVAGPVEELVASLLD